MYCPSLFDWRDFGEEGVLENIRQGSPFQGLLLKKPFGNKLMEVGIYTGKVYVWDSCANPYEEVAVVLILIVIKFVEHIFKYRFKKNELSPDSTDGPDVHETGDTKFIGKFDDDRCDFRATV